MNVAFINGMGTVTIPEKKFTGNLPAGFYPRINQSGLGHAIVVFDNKDQCVGYYEPARPSII